MFKSPIKHDDNIFAFNFLHMELSNCLRFDLAGMAQPPASSANCRLDLFLNHIAAMEELDGKWKSSEDGPQMQWRFSASAGPSHQSHHSTWAALYAAADHNHHNQSTVAALLQAQTDIHKFKSKNHSMGWQKATHQGRSWGPSRSRMLREIATSQVENKTCPHLGTAWGDPGPRIIFQSRRCSAICFWRQQRIHQTAPMFFSHRQKMPEVQASLKYIPGIFASDVCNPELLATLTDTNEGVSTRTWLQRWCGLRGCKQDCQPNARFSWVFWCCPCCATFPSPYATSSHTTVWLLVA